MKNLLSLFLLVFPLILTGQNVVNEIPWPEKGIWPESPRARAFREVAMPSPGLLTGACEFSVPLYTLEVEGLSLPLQLNYHSNGIRLEDDPCPVGYGWVLSPALRVTRHIMGRPDEYFKFAGENFHVNPDEDYQFGFRSTTIIGAELITDAYRPDRYDTEHDIFTIHLIDKTFNVILHNNKFIGANIGEYKIENDMALSNIIVTDPKGIIYKFSTPGQQFSELCRTEWLLSSMVLPSGKVLSFSWEAETHHDGIKNTYEALTLRYDNLRYFDENDPQRYPANNHVLQNEKNLKSITFPGGCIEFFYVGDMLESMRVKWNNPSSQVYTAHFIHDFGDLTKGRLLKGIVSSTEGTYTFKYNDTAFPDTGATDWWGFYNGINNNHIFYPTVKLIKGKFPRDHTIYGANKTPVADKMQANILTTAILPTGGCIEWEYEPHRFAPQGNEPEIRSTIEEPILSFGGGLRVKKITMRENISDSSGMVKHYIYGEGGNGLAVVEALPLLRTFIDDNIIVEHRNMGNISECRCLTINIFSRYSTGLAGMQPIWYSQVTEVSPEGKTEYFHRRICSANRVIQGFGYGYPADMSSVFSPTPQLVEKKTYKDSENGYQIVERVINDFDIRTIAGKNAYLNFTFTRDRIQLDCVETAPDCGESEACLPYLFSHLTDRFVPCIPVHYSSYNDWFCPHQYYITVQSEALRSVTTETCTQNGVIAETETYTYVDGTGLVRSVRRARGKDVLTTVTDYAYGATAGIHGDMARLNVVGVPLAVTREFNGWATGYRLEMQRTATDASCRTFRPVRIMQWRGNSGEWPSATYTYDNIGNPTSRTDAASVTQTWEWGYSSRYPTASLVGGKLRTQLQWKALVGVTGITDPAGVYRSFSYDTAGRLSNVFQNHRLLEKYTYTVGQTSPNTVTADIYTGPSTFVRTVDTYDGLGRKYLTETLTPTGRRIERLEYDAMGRPSRRWAPLGVSVSGTIARDNLPRDHELTLYEPSPRKLAVSVTRAGAAWHNSGKKTVIGNFTNGAAHPCYAFTITDAGATCTGAAPAGTVSVQRVTDEDGAWVETHTDMRGLTVARIDPSGSTWFVYDGYGDLRYILPPGVSHPEDRSRDDMQKLAFWYDYDSRGRCILRKTPGAREARFRYDPADRLVAEQSVNHPDGEWRVYGYDNCGRLVFACDCHATDAEIDAFAAVCRTAAPSGNPQPRGYSLSPPASLDLNTVWARFYDDYAFIDNLCLGDGFRFAAPSGGSAAPKARPAGLLTGLYAGKGHEAYYYDDDGREMQRVATGHNLGRRTTSYTWDGKPAEIRHDYSATAMPLPGRHVQIDHDGAGRPVFTTVREGDRSEANVDRVYDALGDVAAVEFRGGTVSYTRDLHGWPTSATYSGANGSVNERLRYADPGGGATACFNGNISSRILDDGRYDYSYDASNRLVRAAFTPPAADTAGTDFSAEYSYDARGNITDIRRRGVTERLPDGTETFGYVENRSVSHDGNRIRSVNNYAAVSPGMYTGARALPATGMRMAYDFAGRLVSDATRGITRISYDNDGHPTAVTFGDGARHAMTYDGLGRLMSVAYYVDETVTAPSGSMAGIVRTTCLGSRRYTGDGHVLLTGDMVAHDSVPGLSRAAAAMPLRLEESRFGDGFFDARGNDMYYIRDWQGNVAAVADGEGNVVQRTGYYPYGMPWRPVGAGSSNRVLFGGKEYHTADGLNEYDFDARRHYPRFPAFTTPDPHADNTPWLSPYVFCAANPMAYVDPSGMDQFKYNEDGHLIERIEDNDRDVVSAVSTSGTEIDSVELPYGTVSVDTQQKDKNGNPIMTIECNNSSSGEIIFKLLSDVSMVEFSLIVVSDESQTSSIITSSHKLDEESGMSSYLVSHEDSFKGFGKIDRHIHSHPQGTASPSEYDIRLVRSLNNWNGKKVKTQIYLRNNQLIDYEP